MSDDVPQPVEEEAPTVEATPEAPETPSEAVEPAPPPKAQRRIQHLSARANEALRRAEDAERKLAEAQALLAQRQEGGEKPAPTLTAADIDAAAEQKIAEREQRQRRTALVNAGAEEFGAEKWNEATNYLATAGLLGKDGFLETLGDLDGAHQVVMALADDPDAVAEMLSMRPVAMAARLGRMAAQMDKPETAPKLSKAPTPITPVKPGRVAAAPDPSKMTTEQYLAFRKRTAPKHLGGQGQAA